MQVTKLWRQDLMIQRHIKLSAESTKAKYFLESKGFNEYKKRREKNN